MKNINHKHLGAINHHENIKPKKGDSAFMKELKARERKRLQNEPKELTDEDFWP